MQFHTGTTATRPSTLTIHIGQLTAEVLVGPMDSNADIERKIRKVTTTATLSHLHTRRNRTMELLAE